MSKAQKIAIYLRGIKSLRLNDLYSYCEKQGLSAKEIEFVKWYINNR